MADLLCHIGSEEAKTRSKDIANCILQSFSIKNHVYELLRHLPAMRVIAPLWTPAVLTQTHVHTILTEISNAALSVLFHQYVFALQVSVGNSWLAMSAKDLDM